jgi:hypothetical protein
VVGLVKGLWTSVKRLWQSSPTGAREHVCGFWGGWWRRGVEGSSRLAQEVVPGLVEVVCGASREGAERACRGGL